MTENEDVQLPPEQERQAILDCQRGDMQAFEILYQRYHRGLYGYLLSMLRSHHAAEDLTQDIFVKLFRQIGSYNFQAPFSHWLFRMARNLAIDQIRRDKVRLSTSLDKETDGAHPLLERLPGREPSADQGALDKERSGIVLKAVQELPEAFRALVVMREWEDLSYEAISQRLDLSVGTVKSRLFRARALLAKKLKNWQKE